ncbi:hypothetical protein CJD36_008180 [Flavipsychrobacter stenotrophus]|uniref:Uncharacterized protein n=1 Tax=Flavipsychrobacter stenotrophus TaxID=2077091 RepID=A0A2S7SXW1_9BACT|nr:hypothetical protein [Flavipsychrobacter stenotrophus]PQJ11762.1 hypothetical protein CJD36_008180 [Flavipsychrobacter stenotrophus]
MKILRVLGIAILLIATFLGCVGVSMDTTVMTNGGDSVYNTGLIAAKSNTINVAGYLAIIAVLIIGKTIPTRYKQ